MNVIFTVEILSHRLMNDGEGSKGVQVQFDSEDVQGSLVIAPERAAKFPVGATAMLTLEIDEPETEDAG